jgi:hypothetical protein
MALEDSVLLLQKESASSKARCFSRIEQRQPAALSGKILVVEVLSTGEQRETFPAEKLML